MLDCEPNVLCRTVTYVRYSNSKSGAGFSESRKKSKNTGSRARQAAGARGQRSTLQCGCNARRWLKICVASCEGCRLSSLSAIQSL